MISVKFTNSNNLKNFILSEDLDAFNKACKVEQIQQVPDASRILIATISLEVAACCTQAFKHFTRNTMDYTVSFLHKEDLIFANCATVGISNLLISAKEKHPYASFELHFRLD